MTIAELKGRKFALVNEQRAIATKAQAEKRGLSAEDRQALDRIEKDIAAVEGEIEVAQRLKQTDKLLAAMNTPAGRRSIPGKPGKPSKPENRKWESPNAVTRRSSPEYRKCFDTYLRAGFRGLQGLPEARALQADSDIVGGYLIPPQKFIKQVILFVKNLLFIRQMATVIPVTDAHSLGVPALDADPADADWTAELLTGSEDSTMAIGQRELSPRPLAKLLKCSNKLLRLAEDAESLVRDRLSYKFAVTEEKAFMTGTGSNQPLGVFTASNNGIDSTRDVSSAAVAKVTADDVIACKYNVKQQYMGSKSVWIAGRPVIQQFRQLKDGMGQYMWQPGLEADRPDQLLGNSVYMSEYAPAAYASGAWQSGLYAALFGDCSFYWIADSLNMAIQRLDELYAATNQVGFLARMELDGMPVLAEAFSRLKVA